jgi:hypothetical protein
MTTEVAIYVQAPEAMVPAFTRLEKQARAALLRAGNLPPGDRSELIRFEGLCAGIDQLAVAAIAAGNRHVGARPGETERMGPSPTILRTRADLPGDAPALVGSWLDSGHMVVELRLPHGPGETLVEGEAGLGPPPPAPRWSSGSRHPDEAMQERFEFLVSDALGEAGTGDGVLRPDGITNSVLTETLLAAVARQAGRQRANLPVHYQDGSVGPPFPLRALAMTDAPPGEWRELRFTLMSIRHVDMDEIVHGAWLRNGRISRPRPMGATDEVAFETSRRQLLRLDPAIPTAIHMYQTGFAPAVIGFYRAVTCHLLEYPGSIMVAPHYYRHKGGFTDGAIWATQ